MPSIPYCSCSILCISITELGWGVVRKIMILTTGTFFLLLEGDRKCLQCPAQEI